MIGRRTLDDQSDARNVKAFDGPKLVTWALMLRGRVDGSRWDKDVSRGEPT